MTASREKQVANGLLYLLPIGVASVVPLVTLPVFTRALTTDQYGMWALAMVYGAFSNGIANLGLTVGYERNFFQHTGTQERAALLYSVVSFVVLTFALTGVVTWIWRAEIARFLLGDASQGALVFGASCVSAVTGVKAYYLLYFRNSEDAKRYAWYSIDETILGAVVSLALVAWLKMGPIGLVLGQLTASSVVFVAVVLYIGRQFRYAYDWSLLKDALKISLPLTPRIFLGVVGSNFDKYLISLLNTLGGVGVYTIGQRVAYVAFQYMTALENVFTPQVYKRMFEPDEAVRASIGRYLSPFAYASTAVAVGIALFAEEGLWLLTPTSYGGAVPVAGLLAVSYALMFFGKMPQLTYARKTYLTSVLTMVSILANVGINLVTVPRWGAVGAAAGTLAAGVITGIVGFVMRQHYYPIRWEYGRLAWIFGLLAIFAIGAVILPSVVPAYPARLAIKLACLAGYAWLGVRYGYISADSLRLLRNAAAGLAARKTVS